MCVCRYDQNTLCHNEIHYIKLTHANKDIKMKYVSETRFETACSLRAGMARTSPYWCFPNL